MESRAHSGSNVTGVYKKLYVAQSLKVMAQGILQRILRAQLHAASTISDADLVAYACNNDVAASACRPQHLSNRNWLSDASGSCQSRAAAIRGSPS
jgi:hypothetical protein